MENSENKNTDDSNESIVESKKITNLEFIFVILTIVMVSIYIIKTKTKNKNNKLLDLIKNKFFVLFNILLLFSLYYVLIVLDNKYIKLKNALKQSFIAYIIALYAYFDLLIAPGILVFIISYLFHIEV